MPVATKKRAKFDPKDIKSAEVSYLLSGHDFFDEIHPEVIKMKWDFFRDQIMEAWLRFKPFVFAGEGCSFNDPGTRPYAWWNMDHPEYRRKYLSGAGAYGNRFWVGVPECFEAPGAVFESQAAFLESKGLLTDREKKFFKQNEMILSETI